MRFSFPFHSDFFPSLVFLVRLDDEEGNHQNRFVLVGKKSDDLVFSSFLYLYILVELQSNKCIVSQITEK